MSIAEKIKIIRKKAFLSQESFAKEIGVSLSTVNRWENGRSNPNYSALKRINEFCEQRSIDFDMTDKSIL